MTDVRATDLEAVHKVVTTFRTVARISFLWSTVTSWLPITLSPVIATLLLFVIDIN
jgi:hypothetical protein